MRLRFPVLVVIGMALVLTACPGDPSLDEASVVGSGSGHDSGALPDAGADAGPDAGLAEDGGRDAGARPDAGALPARCAEVDLSARVAISGTNQWVEVRPRFELPDGGSFGNRAWTKLLYDSTRHVFLLYEGYVNGSEYPYTIYSNALFTYDPVTNVLALDKPSRWYNGPGPGYDTLARPENATDPTPGDRHQTQTFAFAPDEGAAYLWSGLNQALERPQGIGHPIDLWRYDVRQRRWTELSPATMPAVHSADQAMAYVERTRQLVLFGAHVSSMYRNDQTWVYGLDPNAWRFSKPTPSPSQRVGASLVSDPLRDRLLLLGGGWALNGATHDLWAYSVDAGTWSQLSSGGVGAVDRAAHGFAYDCRHDLFLAAGGRETVSEGATKGDSWVFRPALGRWSEVERVPNSGPQGAIWGDMAYSPAHDLFFAMDGNEGNARFWILRLAPSSLP